MDAYILATLSLEQLQQRLSEALDAQHQLMLGKNVVELHFGDRSAKYRSYDADSGRLSLYISSLKSAIAAKQGAARSGPIYIGAR